MIPNKQLYLVFLSIVLEDTCRPMIVSCFSFYGTWGCLLPGDCILFFFLWHLKMLADRWLHLVFSFYGTWRYLLPGDCILLFFLWHLRMLAAWWLHLAFLSMALEDACCLVIVSCFSFYDTWRCLLPDDCILLFFLWHLKMLAAWWLHLAFLSMAIEDACRPVIASCFSFYGTWRCLQLD